MPDEVAALIDRLRADVAQLTQRAMTGSLSVDDWQRMCAEALLIGYIAAYLLGTDSDDLDDDEADDVQQIAGEQFDHLNDFADVIALALVGGSADDGWLTRIGMYAGAAQWSYWRGATKDDYGDLPCYPGACPECYSNCRCSLDMQPDGVYWLCANDSHSCSSCIDRGATWTPYTP